MQWMSGGGGSIVFDYTFRAATAVPPSSGSIQLDNVTQTAATRVNIAHLSRAGRDNKVTHEQIRAGQEIYIQEDADSTSWKKYTVTADAIPHVDYTEIPVTYKDGGAPPLKNNSDCTVGVILSPSGAIYTLPKRLEVGHTATEPVTDANNANQSGWWMGRPGTTANLPPGSAAYWHLYVIAYDANYIYQMAYGFNLHETWARLRYAGGAWTTWVKIWPIDNANLPARLASASQYATDANTLVQSGWYNANVGPNLPDNSTHLHIYVSAHSPAGYLSQIAHCLYDERIYTRRCVNGSWSAWVQTQPINNNNLPSRLWTGGGGYTNPNGIVQSGWYMVGPPG